MKQIFIICTVRTASSEYRAKLEDYVKSFEVQGINVHLPHRDTKQDARGYDICKQNARAIASSDEVHIFFNNDSKGTHFDMGVAFALGKKIVVVENEEYGEGKSFARMLNEWEEIFN